MCPESESGECKGEFVAGEKLVLAREPSALVRKARARGSSNRRAPTNYP
jgi:hypothetical protein